MKALSLIILTVVITAFVINGYSSFTGTRAKSDDRSDTRTLRKQYDDLVLKNNDLNNTVKTQAKSNKELRTVIVSQKATIAVRDAVINANTKTTDKLKKVLINSQEDVIKLKAIIKRLSISKNYKTKKIRKIKSYKKTVKSARQIRKEIEYKKLDTERSKIKKSLKKAYSDFKRASGIVSRKHRIKSVSKVKNIITVYKSRLRRIEYKIKALK